MGKGGLHHAYFMDSLGGLNAIVHSALSQAHNKQPLSASYYIIHTSAKVAFNLYENRYANRNVRHHSV